MDILSILFDASILIILVVCTLLYFSRGFVSGLVSFIGVFAALVAAFLLAKNLSGPIFDNFLRDSLTQKTAEVIAANRDLSLEELMHAVVSFVPIFIVNSIAAAIGPGFENITVSLAETVVDSAIAPVLIPLISFLLFLVSFLLLRLIFKALANLSRAINNIPVVGAVNRALGCLMGVLIGLAYGFALVCITWALDAVLQNTLISTTFSDSLVLRAMQTFNFFV